MIEIGAFHNGASDLKTTVSPRDVVVNNGSLEEVHQSYQRVLINQVRQGILAEQLGFDYWFMTEHHFMPEGPEFSPNPLLAETAIAAHTKRIRLAQMANILPWWHPIRIAEQAAMLGVISGGRLRVRHRPGIPTPRSRSFWPTPRLHCTRSGTQPGLLPRGLRDHPEGVDPALFLPPRSVFLDTSQLYQMASSQHHGIFRSP